MRSMDQIVKFRRRLWALLVGLGLLRLVSLGLYPLSDTTEARYGNIARLMAETGDWITPQYTLGVPFWGKPPLSTWLSAAAMKLFGVNEFAARLPSFLLALAVISLVWSLAVRQRGRNHALASSVVLMSSALFFVGSGAVMTDPSLLLATTLCMVAFWQAFSLSGRAGKLWGYAFFAGLGLGLLAKGPVAIVLTGLPIGTWIFWQRKWTDAWQRLPWVGGLILTVLLSVPWYWLAELKTPGFLDYFLIGEHWRRFTVPGWEGDLYGNAHLQPKGTIWLYWLACTLPWSLILPAQMLWRKDRTRLFNLESKENGWLLYLVFWALAPMVFFTLAGNILWTYVLPGLPAFALLAAELMGGSFSSREGELRFAPTLKWGAAFMLILFALALTGVTLGYGPAEKSQKELIAAFEKSRTDRNESLTYLFKRPYSAEFYSGGTALLAQDLDKAEKLFQDDDINYFAIRGRDLERLPPSFLARVVNLGPVNRNYLLREKDASVDLAARNEEPSRIGPRPGSSPKVF